MKKIKIIDLLNKIANGEEVPKKIRYCMTNFKYDTYTNEYLSIEDETNNGNISIFKYIFTPDLNEEVEMIEEKKLPEKLPKWATTREDKEYTNVEYHVLEVAKKVDEIINYLESKEKGE